MLKLFVISTVLLCQLASAQTPTGGIDDFADADRRGQGRNLVNQNFFSDEESKRIAAMQEEMLEKCDENGCTYVSRICHTKGWTISFGAGEGGYAQNGNSGTNVYLGGDSSKVEQRTSYGFSIAYSNMKSVTNFKIDDDEFVNFKRRAYGERVAGSQTQMKRLTPDDRFLHLVKLEVYRQMSSVNCATK